MRVKRMTITLPPRLRHLAEHEARLIAQQAAEQLARGGGQGGNIQVELPGNGLSGHSLAHSVARGIGSKIGGRG